MTGVPFFGSEVGAFTPSDAGAYDTASGGFDSNFCRACIKADGNSSYNRSAAIQNLTDAWCAFRMQVGGAAYNYTRSVWIWENSAGADRIEIQWNRLTYVLALRYYNGSAWITAGSTIVVDMVAQRQRIDVHAVVNSATGSVDLYVDGTPRISSGSIDLSGITAINRVRFHGMSAGPGVPVSVSEVIVDDESTIGRRVGTIYMSGNGASTAWVGDYNEIADTVNSDTNIINGVTNGDIELYTGTSVAPLPLTGYRIKALAITARARKQGVGPAQMRFKLRSAGTNYNGTTLAMDFGYLAYFHSWELNPASTAAFLSSEIAALQYGVEALT